MPSMHGARAVRMGCAPLEPMGAEELARWAHEWRTPMLRFAQLHLQPRDEAEDAVQEALLAALHALAGRGEQQDPRRYLFGILKHKVTDRLRQKYRQQAWVSLDEGDDLDAVLFDQRDHWVGSAAPAAWRTPEAQLENDQFFAVVDLCIEALPPKPARVFSMKELLDCEADEVCAVLRISKADYWQCMSRARKQLQLCLTQRWFEGVAR